MPLPEVAAINAAGGVSAELEALLAECDERHVWLRLSPYHDDRSKYGVRYHVLDSAAEGMPVALLAALRDRKQELIDFLDRGEKPTVKSLPDPVPFLAKNLDAVWLTGAVAPPVLLTAEGRTYYRLTPRVVHWFNGAFPRAFESANGRDRAKLRRRWRAFGTPFHVVWWLKQHYRRDQIERAKQHADTLPTLPPGQHPPPAALLKPIRTPSRNRMHNGRPLPIRLPKPLHFDLPEVLSL